MRRNLSFALALLSTAIWVAVLGGSSGAAAMTFTVNTTDDTVNGACDATHCSLREAILAANNAPGTEADTIAFDIPGDGPHVIAPTSALPTITGPVVIDGYCGTCDGATPATDTAPATLTIQIDGHSIGDVFILQGSGSTIRGLAIGGMSDTAITAGGTGGHHIEGNYLGLDLTGEVALGGFHGVHLDSPANVVGGSTPAARNVISGFESHAVDVHITGTGGAANVITGNFIGTDKDGVSDLGSGRNGVKVDRTSVTVIGGGGLQFANVIAFNHEDGINVEDGTRNAILMNSIFDNLGLGIDLEPGGVTPNDDGDADSGSNDRQNFPVLSETSGNAVVQGSLNSLPNAAYTLFFFGSPSCDESGNGEGKRPLGTAQAMTDAQGDAAFTATVATPFTAGEFLTATATDGSGNSSEFSPCFQVPALPIIKISNASVVEGAGGSRNTTGFAPLRPAEFIVTLSRPAAGAVTVRFATANGTAKSPADFQATSGKITFAAGQRKRTIVVKVKDDGTHEGNETFFVNLSKATGAGIADKQGKGTIKDDD
jgi:CSLREA domain-containing protein